ncbi:hypothetical protein QJS10_CPB20g00014 [Acorus calamus]|uniref:Uncharacterized protein n=1 Tax=Acorus calamus TaxID=4465 RepID=A0AAV9CB09_ACOCL|nr:hypothetical protein QJS10_CPB20g00014 [Acorus calamus]
MFNKLFKKSNKKTPSALSSIQKLNESLELLDKKERFLRKKISAETNRAKDYSKLKNKKAAIQCLKKKKMYEAQVEQLGNFQLRIHDQIIMLEGGNATTETMDALRAGASTMKAINQSLSIDDIEKTMEEVTEHSENMKQIQEALAAPVGSAADIDEDELEAELEELEEELEEPLPQPPTRVPIAPTRTSSKPPIEEARRPVEDTDELSTLQAEMAL